MLKPTESQIEAVKLYDSGKIPAKEILEQVIDNSPILRHTLDEMGVITVIKED